MSIPLDERRQESQDVAEGRDPVVRALHDLARGLSPDDGNRRRRFLALVASRRAEGLPSQGRFRFLRRPAIVAAAGAALFSASALGVAATGTAGEVAEHVSHALRAMRDRDPGESPVAPGRTPSSRPLDLAGQHDGDHGDAGAGGIDGSNASDTGIQHANDNAFDGPANAEDRGDNRNPAAPSPASGGSRSSGTRSTATATPTPTPTPATPDQTITGEDATDGETAGGDVTEGDLSVDEPASGIDRSNASETGRDRSSPRAHEAQDPRSPE